MRLCVDLSCNNEVLSDIEIGDVPANSVVNFDISMDLDGIDPGNYYQWK